MSILIVDDSVDNRLLFKYILENAGYTDVLTAGSAHDAFKFLGMENPSEADSVVDLILMDIMMPEMDGIEACRQIKSVERLRDIPIIMVTAKTEEKDIEAAFAAGAMDYITKPLRGIELLVRSRSALSLKKEIDRRKNREQELLNLNRELKNSIETIKTLRGLIPICANCKKIRDDKGYWNQIESYIQKHSEAEFSHGICPECARKLYPELYKD
ncbi:MAG: response regulator [Nitrospinae bacterium]|nr:response regulator [Nitrospinota bacterium]